MSMSTFYNTSHLPVQGAKVSVAADEDHNYSTKFGSHLYIN